MVKKTTKIGKASAACPMISKKTGKKIRTKKERSDCMRRILKGGKSGVKKKRKRSR